MPENIRPIRTHGEPGLKRADTPPIDELKRKAAGERALYRNRDIETLLNKLENEVLDRFDGELVNFMADVLKRGNYKLTFRALIPYIEKPFVAVSPKLAGFLAGLRIGDLGQEWAGSYVKEDMVAKGRVLMNKLMPDGKGFFNIENDGSIWDTIQSWWNNMQEKAEKLIQETITKFGNMLVEGMATGVGATAGLVSYPFMAVGGYLGSSFVIGGSIGVLREIKKSAGFEQIAPFVERSEKMISNGVKNEDGTDPRHDLIVLHKKISEDPRRMGHKLANEEWMILSAAVRRARVDILREKTRTPDIILSPNARREMKTQSQVVGRIIENSEGIADADMEMAVSILAQYDTMLDRDTDRTDRDFVNYNASYYKSIRYSQAFVREGVRGTGLPLVVKSLQRILNVAVKGPAGLRLGK